MKVHIGNYRKNRKVKIEIDPWDTFSLNTTLAKIIAPSLVKFKIERLRIPGVPISFFAEDAELDEHGNYTEAAMEIADQSYIKFLDESIWAMQEVAEGNPGEGEFFTKIIQEEDATVLRRYDVNEKGLKAYQERLLAAFANFGKNFDTLWW